VFTCEVEDAVGVRVGACQLVELGLAKQQEVSAAFGMERTTLYRHRQRLEEGGIGGLVEGRRGPQGAHKLTDQRLAEAQRTLTETGSMRATASALGVSEGTIRHAVKRGRLSRPSGKEEAPRIRVREGELLGPGARAERSVASPAGVGVWREEERLLARLGKLGEAAPQFEPQEAVEQGGGLLALPALLEQGLLEAGAAIYGQLRPGFYGLDAVLLTLANMALLRIKSPEQLQYHPPAELGVLLGLDRVPEVKTLRRKLRELAEQGKAAPYSRWLARRWVEREPEGVGVLYVDGHVRPYHGRKHDLPKAHVPRRRLCMDATTDFWVHTMDQAPLLVVTAEANDSLRSMLAEEILPEVRSLVGDERRVTVVFDREGWSPEFFQQMVQDGFDVLTYRKGQQEPWSEACFFPRVVKRGRREFTYRLADRSVQLRPNSPHSQGFWLREIRRLCDNGHQTAVLTSRQEDLTEVWAERMFSRWGQENFFRYMRHEYALDALVTYDVEPADPDRRVPNPAKKAAQAEVRAATAALQELEQQYAQTKIGDQGEGPRKRAQREKEARQLEEQIRALRDEAERRKQKRKTTPSHVPVATLVDADKIVRLNTEEKHLMDTLKMVAYRAETALVSLLTPHYYRTPEEGRALIRELLQARADVLPQPDTNTLRIRLHPLTNPRSNQAAIALCNELNRTHTHYPNTSWQLHYEPAWVAETPGKGQEV